MSTEQPVVQVYPNSVTNQPPSPSSHSDGSFGSVFIVLAVIVVISAIACFLGRLCNKRRKHKQPKDKKSHHGSKESKHKDTKSKKNAVHGRDGDIEFGFDKGFNPAAKQSGNGGAPKGFKPGGNGEIRGEQLFPGEWEGKAGQY